MNPFEIRLAKQQCNNKQHLVNLDRFFNSERFLALPAEQQKLMIEQFKAQERLDYILRCRMELLGIPCK